MAGKRTVHVTGGTITWDDGQIGVMLRAADGEVGKDVQRRAYAVQKRMKRKVKVRTGALRQGIRVESVSVGPTGPATRIVSDAPHTLVNEFGRGPVTASGALQIRGREPKERSVLNTRNGQPVSLSRSKLRWGSDTSSRPTMLRFEGRNGSLIFTQDVAAAAGSHFMEESVDAAVD